eukprot:TRINITY_DN22775_c0_g4_i1.p1 TRINITY_DN22775_c0_g4~~TRINITY_DN22775_c0_g4_i1.p1  ORF type:complete len:1701 (+),score=392.27 TRINITY_DN22775_c0_g4_i1:58-5160(+)
MAAPVRFRLRPCLESGPSAASASAPAAATASAAVCDEPAPAFAPSAPELLRLQEQVQRALLCRHSVDAAADFDCAGGDSCGDTGAASLEVRVEASDGGVFVSSVARDVGVMRQLRDRVLSGDFDSALQALRGESAVILRADRSQLAEEYEQGVLSLERLTPHQREKLRECGVVGDDDGGLVSDVPSCNGSATNGCSENLSAGVHLKAPAGAGKTFVALHRALATLRAGEAEAARVLWVSRNAALAYFAAAWICRRLRDADERRRLLGSFHVLFEPFEDGPRAACLLGRRVGFRWVAGAAGGSGTAAGESEEEELKRRRIADDAGRQAPAYTLLAVDEAHHLYSRANVRNLVESYITPDRTTRLLLSDLSQSLGHDVPYPEGLREVILHEVVRCSKRIVAGAMAFQLGGEEKLLTLCHHDSAGPPLKSFLFDVSPGGVSFYRCYAENTLRALQHVVSVFPDFSLHNRVALVVPDKRFMMEFREELQSLLNSYFGKRRLTLVSAKKASALVGESVALETSPKLLNNDACASGSACEPDAVLCDDDQDQNEDGEWLLYDSIDQMDGLERLIVIGIGLDSAIGNDDQQEKKEKQEGAVLETRSMLYRAITRSHLMVIIVNEFLRGGWLEFLGSVRLKECESFDSKAELAQSETKAVEGVVKAELTTALAEAASLQNLRLEDPELSGLVPFVTARLEAGEVTDAALAAVLQTWRSTSEVVVATFREVAEKSHLTRLSPSDPSGADAAAGAAGAVQEEFESLVGSLTLQLMKGGIGNLQVAATEALRGHRRKLRLAAAADALRNECAARGLPPRTPEVLAGLQEKAALEAEEAQLAVPEAARRVLEEWLRVEADIAAELRARVRNADAAETESLAAAVTAAVLKGSDVGEAVHQALRERRRRALEAVAAATLDVAIAGASQLAVRRPGAICTIHGLQRRPDLNGIEVRLRCLIVDVGRWHVSPTPLATAKAEEKTGESSDAGGHSSEDEVSATSDEDEEDDGAISGFMRVKESNLLLLEGRAPPLHARTIALLRDLQPLMLNFVLEALLGSGGRRNAHGVQETADAAGGAPGDEEPMEAEEEEQEEEAGAPNPEAARRAADAAVVRALILATAVEAHLEELSTARQLRFADGEQGPLCKGVVEKLWDPEDGGAPAVVTLETSSEDYASALDFHLRNALGDWETRRRLADEEEAQIASALERAVEQQRLTLSDAAMSTLRRRVAAALRRGDAIETAVRVAVQEWHKQAVRKQVQQSIWDPSGNVTKKVTGVVRFMPFKTDASLHRFNSGLLCDVFALLPLHTQGKLARVCKLWWSVAVDPSWKPDLLVYAWGAAEVTGMATACRIPTLLELSLSMPILRLTCADDATFALAEAGTVWFWGRSWSPRGQPDCPSPTQLPELSDIVSVAVSPAGYHHGRNILRTNFGYSCAAVDRAGALYTWGQNGVRQLFQSQDQVRRPTRVTGGTDVWDPATERVQHAACGISYLALSIERSDGSTAVLTSGRFLQEQTAVQEWPTLRGLSLRSLVAGSFHCCALTTRGELYSFGDTAGADHSNGNLLGTGERTAGRGFQPPARVDVGGGAVVSEVSCSTYVTIAITVDGRVFSWGDCDGGALGHAERMCDTPHWLQSLRWQHVTHGALSYTNAAVATAEGRVFVWGGNAWEGGIARRQGGRDGPNEVRWGNVPPCYKVSSVALAHRHGFLVFRKEP